jgi:hypothetical protein
MYLFAPLCQTRSWDRMAAEWSVLIAILSHAARPEAD